MMSNPHKHHFIPAFYLRRWYGSDKKLVEYTIKHGRLIPKPVSADATGFERDLYEIPELPLDLSQFMEQRFFEYADRTASQALEMLVDGIPQHFWSSEMLSAWARFLIGVSARHPDTLPEIRAAVKLLWETSGEQSQRIYEETRRPEDPPTFDGWIAARDPLIPHKAALDLVSRVDRQPCRRPAHNSDASGRLSKSPERRDASWPPIVRSGCIGSRSRTAPLRCLSRLRSCSWRSITGTI